METTRELQLAILGWLYQEGNHPSLSPLTPDDFDPDLQAAWTSLREKDYSIDNDLLAQALIAYRQHRDPYPVAATKLLHHSLVGQIAAVSQSIQDTIRRSNGATNPQQLLNQYQAELATLQARLAAAQHSLVDVRDALSPWLAQVETLAQTYQETGEVGRTGFMTGFAPYDRMTGGWHKGRVVLLGGQSGAGKTYLVITFLMNALNLGEAGFLYCLEMSQDDLLSRIIQAQSGINARKLRQGNLSPEEQSQLVITDNTIRSAKGSIKLSTVDPGKPKQYITMERIRNEIRNEPVTPGLVVLDYADLIIDDERQYASLTDNKARFNLMQDERQALNQLIWECKELAREAGCVVMLLSQFNRDSQGRRKLDARPRLSDFAGSSGLTNTADHVIAIFDPHAAKVAEVNAGEYWMTVLKDRYSSFPRNPFNVVLRRDKNTGLFFAPDDRPF